MESIWLKQYVLLNAYSTMIRSSNSIEADYVECAAEYIKLSKSVNESFISNIINHVALNIANDLNKPSNIINIRNTSNSAYNSPNNQSFSNMSTITNSDEHYNIDNFIDHKVDTTILNVFCEGTSINIGTSSAKSGCAVYSKYMNVDLSEVEYNKRYILSNSEMASNQRAELSAFYIGLDSIEKIKTTNSHHTQINLYITSKYAYNCVNDWGHAWALQKWKRAEGPIKNIDLIRPMYEKLQSMPYVKVCLFMRDKKKNNDKIPEGFYIARKYAIEAIHKSNEDNSKSIDS